MNFPQVSYLRLAAQRGGTSLVDFYTFLRVAVQRWQWIAVGWSYIEFNQCEDSDEGTEIGW